MKFEIKSGCLDFVGVALGVILRVELELESGYIHVVLVSHRVLIQCCFLTEIWNLRFALALHWNFTSY